MMDRVTEPNTDLHYPTVFPLLSSLKDYVRDTIPVEWNAEPRQSCSGRIWALGLRLFESGGRFDGMLVAASFST